MDQTTKASGNKIRSRPLVELIDFADVERADVAELQRSFSHRPGPDCNVPDDLHAWRPTCFTHEMHRLIELWECIRPTLGLVDVIQQRIGLCEFELWQGSSALSRSYTAQNLCYITNWPLQILGLLEQRQLKRHSTSLLFFCVIHFNNSEG